MGDLEMNLIDCPDCAMRISGGASICPHCGAAIKKGWKTSDKVAVGGAVVAALTLILGSIGAIVAFEEFKVQDGWKRREFVVAQIKDFYADRINTNVLLLLDYNPAMIELYPNSPSSANRTKQVQFKEFVEMIKNDRPADDTLLLREQFEHFLKSLSRLNYLVSYNAIDPKELCSDLEYPLSLLGGDPDVIQMKKKNSDDDFDVTELSQAIDGYVTRWKDHSTREFVVKMGKACGFKTPYLTASTPRVDGR
jgi:hypothetical protein